MYFTEYNIDVLFCDPTEIQTGDVVLVSTFQSYSHQIDYRVLIVKKTYFYLSAVFGFSVLTAKM